MPDRRRLLDSHTHVWDISRRPQDWIDPATMGAIARDFTVPELLDEIGARAVSAAVIVQASNSVEESLDILAASGDERIHAVVGWVDLESDDIGEQLAQLRTAPGGGKLAGIRHLAHTESDERWLLRESVGDGLVELERMGLSFDLVVRPWQLDVATELVGAHPQLSFVLDHLGKPPIAGGDLADWERSLRVLAGHENVVAKLSGLTIEADWTNWSPSEIAPRLDLALELFGSSRLMFGSDWPLVGLSGGYGAWLELYLEWSAQLSPAEQGELDELTARAAYRTAS